MGLRQDLDPATAGYGALLGGAIALPPIYIVRAVRQSTDTTTALWVVPVVAIFLAFPAVGAWTSRRRPLTPFLHAIVAGGGAGLIVLGVSLISRAAAGDLGTRAIIPALLVLQIAISLSVIGAWAAGVRARRRNT